MIYVIEVRKRIYTPGYQGRDQYGPCFVAEVDQPFEAAEKLFGEFLKRWPQPEYICRLLMKRPVPHEVIRAFPREY